MEELSKIITPIDIIRIFIEESKQYEKAIINTNPSNRDNIV